MRYRHSLGFLLAAACSSQPAAPPMISQPPPVAAARESAPAPSASASAPPAAVPSVASKFPSSTPVNEVSLALHRALRSERGNLFFSGASVRAALSMTALGAKGATFDEMAHAFALPADGKAIAAAAKTDAAAWRSAAGKAELVVANRLWLDKTAALEKPFVLQAKEGFGAAPETVDFKGAPDPSRTRINASVSETTKGRIKDLLPQGSIDALTRVVLTNAIYFKGQWATAFDKAKTKDGTFRADAGDVTVPMMRRVGDVAYGSNEEVELVQLDYRDSALAMLIALPQPTAKIAAIEAEVSGGEVDAWAKSVAPQKIDLSMPRFTFSWGRSVKRELEGLGMKTAFSSGADFTGVSAQPRDLYISDVFHKAFVLVDEVGTEAAAATGVVMATRAMIMTKTVTIDRPFLFFVRNTKTGDILFQGRVANPQ